MSISRDDALEWIKTCAEVLAENRTYLTELDAAIGDVHFTGERGNGHVLDGDLQRTGQRGHRLVR